MLQGFAWLVTNHPEKVFPRENNTNMSNIKFLEAYPFHTTRFCSETLPLIEKIQQMVAESV